MDNIIKLPSGFYALVTDSSRIINAALKPWDGSEGGYIFNTSESGFNYYQTADKTVYYTEPDGSNARIFCTGDKLRRHLHRLEQIKARRV